MKKLTGGSLDSPFFVSLVLGICFLLYIPFALSPVLSITFGVLWGSKNCSDTDEQCKKEKDNYRTVFITFTTIACLLVLIAFIAVASDRPSYGGGGRSGGPGGAH